MLETTPNSMLYHEYFERYRDKRTMVKQRCFRLCREPLTSWHMSRDSVKMMSHMPNVSSIPSNKYTEAIFPVGIIKKVIGEKPCPPTSPKPTSPKPISPKPTSPKPISPKPTSPKPISPKPTSPKPTSPKPISPKPTSPKPTSPKPKLPSLDVGNAAVGEPREVRVNARPRQQSENSNSQSLFGVWDYIIIL